MRVNVCMFVHKCTCVRVCVCFRPGSPLASMDDYLLKQLRRRSRPSQELQHGSTSPSSHTPHHTNHHGPPYAYITTGPEAVASTSTSSISSKVEDDLNMFFHRDKSKADLRPYTAWFTIKDASSSKEHSRNHHSNTFGGSPKGGLRFLQLRGGSLGTPSRQVRYLDDEEVERRRQLHRYLLGRYRHLEHVRLQSINDRVGQFCRGQSGVTAVPSRPPSERGDSAGLSLPPGVPPMVHRALRVRPQSDPNHHA